MATVAASTFGPRSVAFAGHDSTLETVGRIGPWHLVKELHESELCRVYSARPESSGPRVPPTYAVKVLRKEWWSEPMAIQLQRRSVWVGQKVSHPHVLPVLSAGVMKPPYFTVTPLLVGRPLSDHAGKNRLPLSAVLWALRQVAEALAALHEQAGVIHSDVKPANIVLSPDGHATLIDLGFAHAPSECAHWTQRPVVGTLNYIAPESVTSRMASGPASDLYSLGVTMYELLSGRLPLEADTPEELVQKHRSESPECVRHYAPTLPKPVSSLVHRLLAKDPLRRPGSAMEVAEELTRLEIGCFAAR